MSGSRTFFASVMLGLLSLTGAQAQDVYKVGASVGLTGYAAANDRLWRDGLAVALKTIAPDRHAEFPGALGQQPFHREPRQF